MRYWRHYPKFLQTILLMLLIFTLASFSFIIASFGVTKLFDETIESIANLNPKSKPNLIHAAQFVQAITSLFTFLLSALLFAYLCHPEPIGYLGLRKPKNKYYLLLIFPLMLTAVPIFAQVGEWIKLIDFGAGAKASFAEQDSMIKSLMNGNSISDLLLYLVLFAALPALGEELLFRGVVMRFAYNNGQNIHFAILFSAGIFGLAHGSIYNFFPIMMAGILLGYIYYLGGSMWLNILAHFLNNALAVVLLFLGNNGVIPKEVSEAESLPWYVLIISVVVFIYNLKLLKKNASPLPIDWNDDFRGESLTD